MSVVSFDEKAVDQAVCSEVSSAVGSPVPVSVVVKDDKIELSFPKAMRDEIFRFLCIYVEISSKMGHWQTFYKKIKPSQKSLVLFLPRILHWLFAVANSSGRLRAKSKTFGSQTERSVSRIGRYKEKCTNIVLF